MPDVTIIGAGVAGLTAALALSERGVCVEVIERSNALGESACSWCAGGMLAPYCESESAPAEVVALGAQAVDWWSARVPGVVRNGTLVVSAPRDVGEIDRFAARTRVVSADSPGGRDGAAFVRLDGDAIGALEPDLAGRFHKGLFFPSEGHLDPRAALSALKSRLVALGVPFGFGIDATDSPSAGLVLDCRGFAARDQLDDLRGVRGEMLMLRTKEISFARPIRFLHPRIPLYIVPRGEGLFMVGATMVESAARGPVTARSALELLSAAYALHPAFGEAEIVEMRADARPAFPDNLPRVIRQGATYYFNGLYRHGFLLSPAFAQKAAAMILDDVEAGHEDHRQRRRA